MVKRRGVWRRPDWLDERQAHLATLAEAPADEDDDDRAELRRRRRARRLMSPMGGATMTEDHLTLAAFDAELAALEARWPPRVGPAQVITDDGVEPVVAMTWPPEFDQASRALKDRLERTNPEGYAERYRRWKASAED